MQRRSYILDLCQFVEVQDYVGLMVKQGTAALVDESERMKFYHTFREHGEIIRQLYELSFSLDFKRLGLAVAGRSSALVELVSEFESYVGEKFRIERVREIEPIDPDEENEQAINL